MGVFDRVEKKLENVVGGVFARAFKGDVQPVEITARLQRELDSEARLLSRDRKLVPNEFTIGLSSHDFARLTPYSKTLNAEIAPQLLNYAADKGYIFNGPVSIDYRMEESLPIGRFTITSAAVAGVDGAAAPASAYPSGPTAPGAEPPAPVRQRTTGLVVEVNGVRHPLTAPGLTIGRGTDADLRINDPGVSRLHARINVIESGSGTSLNIEDLGSTNGITVDGARTRQAPLNNGSRIDIGNTTMLITSPVSDV
ncbi:MAG: FHA domain-containing protein [Propionibacteriales bacterium]|nr:FHA domain-containing protein [Propionibacteriales bacterium]